jgi:hypothetical protein
LYFSAGEFDPIDDLSISSYLELNQQLSYRENCAECCCGFIDLEITLQVA